MDYGFYWLFAGLMLCWLNAGIAWGLLASGRSGRAPSALAPGTAAVACTAVVCAWPPFAIALGPPLVALGAQAAALALLAAWAPARPRAAAGLALVGWLAAGGLLVVAGFQAMGLL